MDFRELAFAALKMENNIKMKIEEIEHIRDLLMQVTATLKEDKVQTSLAGDKNGTLVCAMVDLEEQLKKQTEQYAKDKQTVLDVIEKIEDPKTYEVIFRRHVLYQKWDEIAETMNISKQWCHELEKRGIDIINAELTK